LIEFSRQAAKQLRVVIRKLFGRQKPDVTLITGPDGLRLQACGEFHAVEYHDPVPRQSDRLIIPFALLDDVEGTRNEPVRLYLPKKKALAATWEDRGIERTMQYTPPKDTGVNLPATPSLFTENSPELLAAFRDAAPCTDPTSSRYALGCIQLRGNSGQIAVTDGRQLLLQAGFNFGFESEILVHSTEVFSCAELPQDQPVQIGKTDSHVVLKVGPWSFFLAIQKEARFPRVNEIIPQFQSAQTTLELHPADAEFFAGNVSRLPGNASEQAVTFDCNGSIAVRAKTEDSQATEIVLTNSTKTGSDVTICLDRRNLASMARMGFDRVYLYGKENAVLARDDKRSFLFMPLHEQKGIKASNDCLTIPSPVSSGPSFSRRAHPFPYTPSTSMPNNRISQVPTTPESTIAPDTNSATQPIRRRRRKTNGTGSVLEQAVTLRDQLREVLTSTKELVRTLKTERRSQKSLKIALDSLKNLQAVA
jgi:hypothetical protein